MFFLNGDVKQSFLDLLFDEKVPHFLLSLMLFLLNRAPKSMLAQGFAFCAMVFIGFWDVLVVASLGSGVRYGIKTESFFSSLRFDLESFDYSNSITFIFEVLPDLRLISLSLRSFLSSFPCLFFLLFLVRMRLDFLDGEDEGEGLSG